MTPRSLAWAGRAGAICVVVSCALGIVVLAADAALRRPHAGCGDESLYTNPGLHWALRRLGSYCFRAVLFGHALLLPAGVEWARRKSKWVWGPSLLALGLMAGGALVAVILKWVDQGLTLETFKDGLRLVPFVFAIELWPIWSFLTQPFGSWPCAVGASWFVLNLTHAGSVVAGWGVLLVVLVSLSTALLQAVAKLGKHLRLS